MQTEAQAQAIIDRYNLSWAADTVHDIDRDVWGISLHFDDIQDNERALDALQADGYVIDSCDKGINIFAA